MAKAAEIEKMFVGFDKGKVKVLDFDYKESKKEWTLQYQDENGKTVEVGNKDFDFMQGLFVEFGGRNPETCKAASSFLSLDGSWKSKDLMRLGHRITKIALVGRCNHRKRSGSAHV